MKLPLVQFDHLVNIKILWARPFAGMMLEILQL